MSKKLSKKIFKRPTTRMSLNIRMLCISDSNSNDVLPFSISIGLTIFTSNFLDAMQKANPNENLFFSPFSLYHALLLAYFGSAGHTEKKLKVI